MITPLAATLACVAAVLGLGVAESLMLRSARRQVTIRIHVNGSRGKSTVTRLLWAALRQAGIPTLAKVTGTAPRWLLPDGREEPVRRRGRPNIREQSRALLRARRLGAEAVVLECMAIHPELQWVSEHAVVRSTIGVITNVRSDHGEVMGRTLEETAGCLANTVPRGGVVVLGEDSWLELFRRRAAALGSRVVAVEPAAGGRGPGTSWLDTDCAVALGVTRELGIADAVATAGMTAAPADPGAAAAGSILLGGRRVAAVDAAAANDPQSLALVLAELAPAANLAPSGVTAAPAPTLVVYNHRSDRPHRLLAFAAAGFGVGAGASVVVTGERPCLSLWRRLRSDRCLTVVGYVPSDRLRAFLAGHGGSAARVVLCGNTRGLPPGLLEVDSG